MVRVILQWCDGMLEAVCSHIDFWAGLWVVMVVCVSGLYKQLRAVLPSTMITYRQLPYHSRPLYWYSFTHADLPKAIPQLTTIISPIWCCPYCFSWPPKQLIDIWGDERESAEVFPIEPSIPLPAASRMAVGSRNDIYSIGHLTNKTWRASKMWASVSSLAQEDVE